ncbi:MAG: DUF6272 family protein [Elainellaceae cyanobacterium]
MTSASTSKTYGEYTTPSVTSQEYLTIHFSPTAAPRQKRWRNYGLSADFLGDYFATFFPGKSEDDDRHNPQDTIKAAVSYIANELLENAIKYSSHSHAKSVSVSLYLDEEHIIFQVINYVDIAAARKYENFIKVLLSSDDVDALYSQYLERAAMGEGESHMGILTMVSDYNARFGWQFRQVDEDLSCDDSAAVQVEVIAYLGITSENL